MLDVIFVSHGKSVANAEGSLAGHIDAPLTDRGRAQARETASELDFRDFRAAFSSDSSRARETAEILLERGGPPLVTSVALRERFLGDWEGARADVLRENGGLALLMTWAGRPPGGEDHADCARRMLAFLATIAEGPVLIVSHATALRAVIGILDGLPQAEIGRFRIGNAEALRRQVVVP